MLKKTISYTDFNGVERKEDFYFNLSKAEIMEMQYSTVGGLDNMLNKIIAAQDTKLIMETFKKLILKAYGQKSDDGKRFIKSEQLAKEFEETEAYSVLYMELATNDTAAAAFVNGIIPKDLAEQVSDEMNKGTIAIGTQTN